MGCVLNNEGTDFFRNFFDTSNFCMMHIRLVLVFMDEMQLKFDSPSARPVDKKG